MSEWKAIEAQASADLEAIQTDQDAYAFIEKYLSKELRPDYLRIYRSDRHELFPGVTSKWTHKERQQDGKQQLNTDPYITHMKNGKLHIDTKDATFRV